MKLEAFVTLDAVLRLGTMAAAAQELHITPSAVSMQIKQIETYLGQPLFNRSGLRVEPMPLALEVSEAMQHAQARLEKVRRRPVVVVKGNIRLGVIASLQPIVVPATMRLLRDRYSGLQVQPSRGKSTTLTAAVKAGEIDAAVVAQPESGGSMRLSWQPLVRQELFLIAPPAATETSLKALFRRYDWIRYDRQTVSGRMAARYINTHVAEKHSTLELDEARAIVAMVNAGLGVSVVQLAEPSICTTYPVKVLRLARDTPELTISLVTRHGDAENRAICVLKEAIAGALAAAAAIVPADVVRP
jgi:DNA-binding transcriptional LysR family regulator